MHNTEILGIGAPILDHIVLVDDAFINTLSGKRGGTDIVSIHTFDKILRASGKIATRTAGGSCTNAIKGLAKLGHKSAITGKLGRDSDGDFLTAALKGRGVRDLYKRSHQHPTGRALSLVTPDGERTMRTCIGAAGDMRPDDLNAAWFSGVRLVHIEGYAILNHGLAERAMVLAKEHGALVSFDLASFEIATRFRDDLVHLLARHIDVLFANEKEAIAFTGVNTERSLSLLKDLCDTVVIFLGDQGGIVAQGNNTFRYPARPVTARDTTGAGDLFASGFLHGLLTNAPLEECAALGALTASFAVQTLGAELSDQDWEDIRYCMKSLSAKARSPSY